MNKPAKIILALLAARLLYWPTKALIAAVYNRMTPDIDTDLRLVEYDGFITVHPPIK